MKALKLILCGLMIAGFATADVWAKGKFKIGYVDLSRVFDSYERTKEFDKELEGEHKAYQDEKNAKIEVLKDKQGRLALLKEEEKAKLEEELEKLKAELLEFDRQKRTDLTRKRDERVREILLEIEKHVSDYAKKEKYDMIVNDRVLIYGEKELDLTETVLKDLNSSYKK